MSSAELTGPGDLVRRPARVQRPERRLALARLALLAALVLFLVLGALFVVARQTGIFALRGLEITGATERIDRQVESVLQPFMGKSLVGLDTGAVVERLRTIPAVVSASVERDFPHTLAVHVSLDRGVAVIRQGADAWLVSSRGRVLASIDPRSQALLPRIWVATSEAELSPGTFLLPEEGGAAVAAIARVPRDFPMRVEAATGDRGDLRLVLGNRAELRLGDDSDVRLKLEAAAVVLRSLTASERAGLGYLDVSIPTRVVAFPNSQVEG